MTATVVLAAFVGAVAVFFVARALIGESMRLSTRIGPYTVRARRELGTTQAVSATAPVRSVWGPMLNSLTTTVAKIADAGEHDTLELRIRNAGMNITVDAYRRRQLLSAVAGAAVGMALAIVARPVPVAVTRRHRDLCVHRDHPSTHDPQPPHREATAHHAGRITHHLPAPRDLPTHR